MKQWVKLDRRLTDLDRGKIIRNADSNQKGLISAIDYQTDEVLIETDGKTLRLPNGVWKSTTEIEEHQAMVKQWVKLDRELTEQDVGKRLRQGLIVAEIIRHTPRYVYVRSMSGYEFPLPTDWSSMKRDDTEIEEEVTSTQNLASGYAMWAGNSITIDPSSAAFRYYFNYGVPNNSVAPTPRHDCYLDGHSIVETGTLRSACKHCEQPAEWDRESCSWVLKNANNS